MFLRFSFITSLGLTYFAMSEAAYPSVLVFSFLNEIMKEFVTKYELMKVNLVRRPYSFIEFGEACDLLHMLYMLLIIPYVMAEVMLL